MCVCVCVSVHIGSPGIFIFCACSSPIFNSDMAGPTAHQEVQLPGLLRLFICHSTMCSCKHATHKTVHAESHTHTHIYTHAHSHTSKHTTCMHACMLPLLPSLLSPCHAPLPAPQEALRYFLAAEGASKVEEVQDVSTRVMCCQCTTALGVQRLKEAQATRVRSCCNNRKLHTRTHI
jgi:hypothetical protein